MTKQNREAREKALTHEDVANAVKRSGFPLEIRLLRAMTNAKLTTAIGVRAFTGADSRSCEIDVMGSAAHRTPELEFTMRVVVQAKAFAANQAFVGFTSDSGSLPTLEWLRARLGGCPCIDLASAARNGLQYPQAAAAFAPLATTVCVQWSSVTREQDGTPTTGRGHDDAIWDDMDKVIRATSWLRKQYSEAFCFRGIPTLLVDVPVLVLATSNLFVFDETSTPSLRQVGHLALCREFEANGVVEEHVIDVVAESALPDYLASFNESFRLLAEMLQGDQATLLQAMPEQRAEVEVRMMREHREKNWPAL